MPRRGNALTKAMGRAGLRLGGWRMEGEIPNVAKAVAIVVPHTSNWDFLVAIAGLFAVGVRVSWLGKNTIFKGAAGPVMEWLGGVPIDRTASVGAVDQIVERFNTSETLVIGLSPEGTRSRVDRWKTGFYNIALKAGVPIAPIAFDWKTRVIHFGEPLIPCGDLEADIALLEDFFKGAVGKRPVGMAKEGQTV